MRRFLGLCAAATLAVGGLGAYSTAGTGSAVYADACAASLAASTTGPVTNPDIREASGIVASRRQPGIYWVHNDSGDTARFFAIDAAGRRRATYVLRGITALDWEDIALGPGPIAGVDYLYIGDIGDNFLLRDSVRVLRLREPTVPAVASVRVISSGVASLRLRYPDRRRNAEAMMVDPRTAMLYVVTKRVGSEGIRIMRTRATWPHGSRVTLIGSGRPSLPHGGNVTAVDMSRDGRTIALRTYDDVYVYDVAPGEGTATALQAVPCIANAALEPQGEAIAFHADDRGFVTFSEGANQPLNHRDA